MESIIILSIWLATASKASIVFNRLGIYYVRGTHSGHLQAFDGMGEALAVSLNIAMALESLQTNTWNRMPEIFYYTDV